MNNTYMAGYGWKFVTENDDDDDDDDDVRSITPEDEAPIVNVIDEANTAGTCNELECTSNGVSQDNAALLLNIMVSI